MKRRSFFKTIASIFAAIWAGKAPPVQAEPIDVLSRPAHKRWSYLKWGTYGKNCDEPLHFMRLVDCETSHLQAILVTCKYISEDMRKIIRELLAERGERPSEFSQPAHENWMGKFRLRQRNQFIPDEMYNMYNFEDDFGDQ